MIITIIMIMIITIIMIMITVIIIISRSHTLTSGSCTHFCVF